MCLPLMLAVMLGAAPPEPPARYQVVLAGETLEVDARFSAARPLGRRLGLPPESARFVRDLAVETAPGRWRPLEARGDGWILPADGGHVRYRFGLGAAADAIEDVDVAARCGQALVAPPSTWLLRPGRSSGRLAYELRVTTAPGVVFASALVSSGGRYLSSFGAGRPSSYAAFGPFSRESISVGGGLLDLAMVRGALDHERAAVRAWVLTAARAVSAYFGRLPVPRPLVLVVEKRRGVHGKQMGDGEASVLLQIAPGADLHDRAFDWIATHEMVHLGAPNLPHRHLWLEEGLATYVEPLARALVRDLDTATVWREMVQGMPQGEPAEDDDGLDRSSSWASTYWGGALFCLEADLAIRRATRGVHSLRTALRAVQAAGGDARASWTVDRFLDTADRSVGEPVLRTVYQTMARRRHTVDLPRLWAALGVVTAGPTVVFDDRAPEAALRRAITAP